MKTKWKDDAIKTAYAILDAYAPEKFVIIERFQWHELTEQNQKFAIESLKMTEKEFKEYLKEETPWFDEDGYESRF